MKCSEYKVLGSVKEAERRGWCEICKNPCEKKGGEKK
jgi:hypothetical protein